MRGHLGAAGVACATLLGLAVRCGTGAPAAAPGVDASVPSGRYIYAALLDGTLGVYDIDAHHRRVKTIGPLALRGSSVDLRGLSANARTHQLFLSYVSSTGGHIVCVDLRSDAVLWHHDYSPGVDRGDIGPGGEKLFVPTNEDQTAAYEMMVDPSTGIITRSITLTPKSHDTDIGPSGRFAYLETKSSTSVVMVDAVTGEVARSIGPFSGIVGPHAVNGSDTLMVANVFGFYGFVVASAQTGAIVAQAPIRMTADPGGSGLRQHGVAWKPDETEVWVTGGPHMHVFAMATMPPSEVRLVSLPGYTDTHWINFSIDGAYAYPSPSKGSGTPVDVVDTRTYETVDTIDYSEDLLEVDFADGGVARVGDQYGIGRKLADGDGGP